MERWNWFGRIPIRSTVSAPASFAFLNLLNRCRSGGFEGGDLQNHWTPVFVPKTTVYGIMAQIFGDLR